MEIERLWSSEKTGVRILAKLEGSNPGGSFCGGHEDHRNAYGVFALFQGPPPRIRVLGVEPCLDHRIQGIKNINEAIVPPIYDPSLLDDKIMCEAPRPYALLESMKLSDRTK